MPRNPLALGRRLKEHSPAGAAAENGREALAGRGDAPLNELAIGSEDAELALALVEIESYRIPRRLASRLCLAALTA